MNKKKPKVCLISSCGGHFMELMQLLPAVKDSNFYIITEYNSASIGTVKKYHHYYLLQQERKNVSFIFKFAINILLSIGYLIKERPDIILTTGAGASYPTCRIGKILGKKIIYVESFAKLKESSVTGKLVYPFADYFFIQWPEMKKVYPRSIYCGTVY